MASASPGQKPATTTATPSGLPAEVASLDLFAGEWQVEGDVH